MTIQTDRGYEIIFQANISQSAIHFQDRFFSFRDRCFCDSRTDGPLSGVIRLGRQG